VHDVCQWKGFKSQQRKQRVNRGTVEKLFYDNMERYSKVPMELAVIADGIEHYPKWVEYIKARPAWTVCCHGLHHIRHNRLSVDECQRQLSTAKQLIEDAFEASVKTFIPPFNAYTDNTREIAADLGMTEHRRYRKFGSYTKNISTCTQLDTHYWDRENNIHLEMIVKDVTMEPPIIIIGAPRSGTTAYMRYTAFENPNYLTLKEHEKQWNRKTRIRNYYARRLVGHQQTGIIDKNVRNTFRILRIQKIYPGAQFIFIYRNPRAAISSWRDWAIKTKKQDTSIEGAARQYYDYVSFWIENRDKLNNWKEERYESLCDSMRYFVSRDYKWQKRLTASDIKIIDEIVKPLRSAIGYE
jgi:hypothetical protein